MSGRAAARAVAKSLQKPDDVGTVVVPVLWYTEQSISMADRWSRGSGAATANKVALAQTLAEAVTAKKAVEIPAGDWYCAGGVECLTGLVPIICKGTVYTNTTVPLITMKAVGGEDVTLTNFYVRGGTYINTNGTTAQKGSSIIKLISDGAKLSYADFTDVVGYGFYQMFDDAAGTYTTPFGQESRINHTRINGCVPIWYGSLNAKYCVRRRSGSGTGWLYNACRDNLAVGDGDLVKTDPVGAELIGYPAYVRIEAGGVNAVVSDTLFDGHVSGLEAGAISIDGNCSYRSNVSMSRASQIDAQAKRAIFFDPAPTGPVINMSIEPINVGGDIDITDNFPRSVGSRITAQGFGEATGGIFKTDLAAGPLSIDLCSVQMELGYSCQVELWVSGAVQGVAIGHRMAVYSLRHDGASVTATEIAALGFADPTSPSTSFFAFDADVVADTATFSIVMTASASGSFLQAQYRVTGGYVKARRLTS